MKEVFVFGAGASHASGNTPLGVELVWKYHESCMLFSPVEGGRVDNTAENERFKNLDKFLVLAAKIYPELEIEARNFRNRKQFMYTAPLFLPKKYYVDEILKILQENNSREDVTLIKKLIAEHIVGSRKTGKTGLYKTFKTKVVKSKEAKNVAIISFNFDSLLHEDSGEGFCFDYILGFDPDLSYRKLICEGVPVSDYIPLIKLNGSLDWGICTDCNRVVKYRSPISRFHYETKSCQCGGQMEPFIVIPYEKYSTKIGPLWNKAMSVLKQASKITIIGYSFPEYDTRVIELFRNNIGKNAEIEVVDYCKPEEKDCWMKALRQRYKALFPQLKGEMSINLDGFEAYLTAQC